MNKNAFFAAFLLLGLTAAGADETKASDDASDGVFQEHRSRLCDARCSKGDRAKVERCTTEKGGELGKMLMEMQKKCDCACQSKKKEDGTMQTPEQKKGCVLFEIDPATSRDFGF